jgi:hypothetical protein
MKVYYSETRPNGKPVEPGMLCLIYEVEGMNPQAVYGKTPEEINTKLAKTLGHAQAEMLRLRTANAPTPAPRLTPEQVVQNVNDLNDPERAGNAIVTLIKDTTGLDLTKEIRTNFQKMGEEWEDAHPDFYPHAGNRRLLMEAVLQLNGLQPTELAKITPEMLTAAFQNLQARGLLFEAPEEPQPVAPNPPQPTPAVFPGENPVQPAKRPFATGTRSTRFGGAQVPPKQTPKYTERQIKTMSPERQRELIETGDRDYAYACEFYFGPTAATA